ncbi:hypothetical protein Pst134EB_008516 [Puccinia striiformis f. sp. tritici]|nr:hypothetical protein Pst134EB_008516 [Puccinia striiformis f. sp. tritici]
MVRQLLEIPWYVACAHTPGAVRRGSPAELHEESTRARPARRDVSQVVFPPAPVPPNIFTVQSTWRAVRNRWNPGGDHGNSRSSLLIFNHQEATTTIVFFNKTKISTDVIQTKRANRVYLRESPYHLKITVKPYEAYTKELE